MRTYSPGHPLVFCHIPKSAGTALTAALFQTLQPTRPLIGADLSLVGSTGLDDLGQSLQAGVVSSPDELPADSTFVAGHFSPGTTMARFPAADHITTLRNPRNRVVSQWIHSRALSEFDLRHWGSMGTAARLGRLPFAEHLHLEVIAPNVDNTITRFLTWPHPLVDREAFIDERHDDELLAVALARLDEFSHVGVVEDPSFMAGFGAWLGAELNDVRANERLFMPRKRRFELEDELSTSTVDLLDHRTRIDQRIWTHVAGEVLGDDPAVMMKSSWETALDRYATAMHTRGEFRPVRQAVVALYELKSRLSPRSA